MTPAPTLIFLHIPKTAGTSFHTALSWQYRGKPSFWINALDLNANGLRQLSSEQRAELRLLRGHMEFGLHELLPQPAIYTTFIREPVARIVSYWKNQQTEARLHPTLNDAWLEAARSMTLEEYIAFGKDTNLDNNQVRRISGMKAPFGECSRAMLEQARRNIAQYFPMVGLTDRFDESLVLMRRALGWKKPILCRSAKLHGTQRDRSALPDSLVKNIRQLNELDEELHAFAREEFENKVRDGKRWVEAEVRRVRRLTRVWSWFVPLVRILAGRTGNSQVNLAPGE